MIYLIDDTNLESVNGLFLLNEEYKRVIYRIETVDDLEESRDRLLTADCIMIHRTFANTNIYKEQIASLTGDGEKIPLVVFSAGDAEHALFDEKYPCVIEGIKKTIFYARLSDFLNTYLDSHTVNLRLIAYGTDHLKIKVRAHALSIFRLIAGKDGMMTISDLANIASNSGLRDLISLSSPALSISYDALLEELEDNPITFNDFKNKINQIVNSFYQYGKNIYSWK